MNIRDEKLRCTKEPYIEDVGPRRIQSIHFSMLSGHEIRKQGEVQVYCSRLYGMDAKPVPQGLLDLHMGPPNKFLNCSTCHGSFIQCPGHFGYLKLTLPVFNVGYFNSIISILKCVCKICGRILLDENNRVEFLRKMRNPKADIALKNSYVKKLREKCKPCRCLRCGSLNGIVKKGKEFMAVMEDFGNSQNTRIDVYRTALSSVPTSHDLDPVSVHAVFLKIPDEDCELLNLHDRPEKLIVTEIAVPPLAIRPSVIVDSGTSNEDNLTSIMRNIVNSNTLLREAMEGSSPIRGLEYWKYLQNYVGQYINSEAPGLSNAKDGVKERGLIQRLKGKQGRFRSNLSGKRVEFTARTVISPDPNMKITEVAVPILMARVLTYPERVSLHNIEKLRQCVCNGPFKYPGANFVSLPDGRRQHLKFGEKKNVASELKCGDVVERHLEDGDVVLFNRQPSLHRMSIMAHRAKIMPWRTLRFNESVCNPYNADFDGDEMNLHVPQTEEARTEALMLMGVQNNLCTPKNGEILVASTQDFLTSSFLITRKDTFYSRSSFSLICCYMGDAMEYIDLPTPAIIKPIELWTGKQIFSVLIRPNASTRVYVNLTVKEKIFCKDKVQKEGVCSTMCPSDGYVYFRNSELLSGQLGKATLGNGNKDGLFSVLLRDYNSHAAASCMNRLAKLSARWIGNHGFSIGIDDVQPGERLNQQKKQKIDDGYSECHKFISLFNEGKLKLEPGSDAAQTLELNVSSVLNNIRGTVAKVCTEELHWRNSPLIMSQCGSKGSPINISQMIACVGQQSVGGRRAPNGFINRTLPHFPINSKAPAAKGFVANSFYSGLTATEFFFHTMGGREGLVDTAVKTAETGYMSRRLMKGLEDLSIGYDLTVRNASGGIIQFTYGDDGMDPAKMEGAKPEEEKKEGKKKEGEKKEGAKTEEPKKEGENNEGAKTEEPKKEGEKKEGAKKMEQDDGFPLNFSQLFLKVKATCPYQGQPTLSPEGIVNVMNDRFSKGDMSIESGCSEAFRESLKNFIVNLSLALRKTRTHLGLGENVSYANVLETVADNIAGVSLKQLQVFLDTCIFRYHLKRIEPGAPIGSIGAQSIGEPGTQMTLKTFHFAGVASMNITLGVPRIREIINASKNISTPIIIAKLVRDDDAMAARIVKSSIEKTVLGEVAEVIKIVLKSSQAYITIKLDMKIIESLQMGISSETVKDCILLHPKMKLKSEHIHSLRNDKLRIYFPGEDRNKLQFRLHTLKGMLPTVLVKGIPTVARVVISEKSGENDKHEYTLYVEGTNLLAVMGTPGIDSKRTRSNHVIEVQGTLGIEAARGRIIAEIDDTMDKHGMTIDIRHMMLLADLMTYKGEVLGITRFGIAKMKNSVLMLASFEKTAEHLFNASFNGREDEIEGVSECIIMGIPMQLGTGILKVRQRLDHIPEFKYGPDPIIC